MDIGSREIFYSTCTAVAIAAISEFCIPGDEFGESAFGPAWYMF